MRLRMGTGGGPPLNIVYDPIIDQVEAIVPHLDITITKTYDSDFHHLNKPSQSTEPLPSPSMNQTSSTENTASTSTCTSNSRHAFNNPPEPSLTSSVINTSQIISSCGTGEITMTLPSTSSSLQTKLSSFEAPHNLESNPIYPSSNGSLSPSRSYFLTSPVPADQPCPSGEHNYKRPFPETLPSNKVRRPGKKVKSHLQQTEKELKARLAMMEEEMGYSRTILKMKIRRSHQKDRITDENLKQAIAARKLAEAQLKKFEEDSRNEK